MLNIFLFRLVQRETLGEKFLDIVSLQHSSRWATSQTSSSQVSLLHLSPELLLSLFARSSGSLVTEVLWSPSSNNAMPHLFQIHADPSSEEHSLSASVADDASVSRVRGQATMVRSTYQSVCRDYFRLLFSQRGPHQLDNTWVPGCSACVGSLSRSIYQRSDNKNWIGELVSYCA